MPYLLNAAYLVAVILAFPWLLYCAVFRGKYRQGLGQKLLGLAPMREGSRTCVWLHAVSVGEINVLQPLLLRIAATHPEWECVISTTTRTGFELARRKYAGYCVFYCPLDFTWAIERAMDRIRPDLLVLTELELWPNLVRTAHQRGSRVAIVNGRLSERSASGYRKLGWLTRPLLEKIDLAAMQTAAYAARIQELGAPTAKVMVTGSIKFDGAETSRTNPRTSRLAQLAGLTSEDTVFLAGSTQHPEEEMALATFVELATTWPSLRLVLVPRHPERFGEVAKLLDRSGVSWCRRSELVDADSSERVILVDTIGELGAWWGTADIGFVGGSMGQRGGQNMIEPAAYGAAVSFGPNTRNFRDVVAMLLQEKAAVVVKSLPDMTRFVSQCLENPQWARQQGDRARSLVHAQVGASDRTLRALEELIAPAGDAKGNAA